MIKQNHPSGLVFVLITLFLDVIGVGLSNPILPQLIAQFVGNVSIAAYYFGALTTTYALMLFVFSPIQGALSDQYGRKPVLLLSLCGTGLSYLGLTFAPNIPWIFVALIVNGLTGASFAVVGAYIADVSSPKMRAQNFGLFGAVLGIGWVVGPALGGLVGMWGLRLPFLIAAILTFINLLYGLVAVSESHQVQHRRLFTWRNANPIASMRLLQTSSIILGLAAVVFFNDLALQSLISTWVLFTTYKFHWMTLQAGLSLALLGLVTAVVQGAIIRPLISRFGEQRTILVGLTLGLLGYLLYAVVSQGWMMYWVIALNGFDFVTKPTVQGLLSTQVSAQQQGALQGALASQTALTSMIGPLVATNLFGYFTSGAAPQIWPEVPFYLGSVLFGLALWIAITTFSKQSLNFDNYPR